MGQKSNKEEKKKYKHLSYEERVVIECMIKENKSNNDIANKLWRDRKTIKREIERSWCKSRKGYKAKRWEYKRLENRIKANHKHIKLLKMKNIWFYKLLLKELKSGKWLSVDAIIGRYKLERWKVLVSTATVYRYINKYNKELKKYLRHKWLKYKRKKYKEYWITEKIRRLIRIWERPEIINKRERIWDYELDLVVWWRSWWKEVLLTIADRKTDYFMIKKLKNKSKKEVKRWIKELLKDKKVYSVTIDNGLEFTDVIDICEEMGIEWYRCDPYSSWQKWINERHNGLIRFYIPKWADIWKYSEEYIKEIENKINRLPRKIFGYKTPEELYFNKKELFFNKLEKRF